MRYSRKYTGFAIVFVLCALPLFYGCQERPDRVKAESDSTASAPGTFETIVGRPALAMTQEKTGSAPTTTALPVVTSETENGPVPDVFFAFDKDTLGPRQRDKLTTGITWLQAHPKATVTIEGHCDERGSTEYNLGLGERRAKAVRDYLVAAGVPVEQLRTVSYGEARPFAPGHDKEAWSQNRRAHFVVAEK